MCIGSIANVANISIVYQRSQNGEVMAFFADVKRFKLSDLVQTGTGIDISLRHGSALVYRDGMGVLASLTYI